MTLSQLSTAPQSSVASLLLIGADASDAFKPYILQVFIEKQTIKLLRQIVMMRNILLCFTDRVVLLESTHPPWHTPQD